jgi:hypothetical protein
MIEIFLGFIAVLLLRNEITYRVRGKLLNKNLELYQKLPEYDAMVISPKYYFLWTTAHWIAWINRR